MALPYAVCSGSIGQGALQFNAVRSRQTWALVHLILFGHPLQQLLPDYRQVPGRIGPQLDLITSDGQHRCLDQLSGG